MTDELGPVSYGIGETQPFLGRELAAPREYAEATAARIDQAVATLLEAAHEQATAIVRRARPALDALAEELVSKETVDGKRLDEIIVAAGFTPAPSATIPAGPALAAVASTSTSPRR
jgi:cell division protease FtsH